ncbi:MAG: shikimate dehydrogenase [Rhizobiaceae bacterium]|nr:shikimate dehydrogenase [Rhizobiaceae bacterium]
MAAIRLGLIGDNIARSRSPSLHKEAGRLCGLDISYDRLIPADLGLDFDAAFDRCVNLGYRGINVTYPYKETVVPRLTVPDAQTARIGACNTVVFDSVRPQGHNTDFTGFVEAFRSTFGAATGPGRVAMVGAGGVGRAIAFAIGRLGARELRIFDTDAKKAERLAAALSKVEISMDVTAAPTIGAATDGVDGLVNCTPIGMVGYPGTPIAAEHMARARWAFDAVYTPVNTEFLGLARDAGCAVMSGYELFFHQGIGAFRHFTNYDVDAASLRRALGEAGLEVVEA